MIEFAYDHNGLRTQKIVTKDGVTTTTDYTLHGKLITHMTQGSNNLHFYYDANSRPAMVNFNGEKYTYVHNLQGDIVAILDTTSTVVVEYRYDAWGKPIATTGSMSASLGKLNPFRYRGYVYDEETGLYYLRSRYYAPVRGRFLNTDVFISIYDFPFMLNVFAYCRNSVIAREDVNGAEDELTTVRLNLYVPTRDDQLPTGHADFTFNGKTYSFYAQNKPEGMDEWDYYKMCIFEGYPSMLVVRTDKDVAEYVAKGYEHYYYTFEISKANADRAARMLSSLKGESLGRKNYGDAYTLRAPSTKDNGMLDYSVYSGFTMNCYIFALSWLSIAGVNLDSAGFVEWQTHGGSSVGYRTGYELVFPTVVVKKNQHVLKRMSY